MKCNRREALLAELLNDWDQLNLAAKVLVFIGGFLFLATIFVALYKTKTTNMYKTIEVILRSSLASIFGFILSSNIKNTPKNILQVKTHSVEEDCKDVVEKRYRNEGNSVQIMIALLISITSAVVMLIIYIFELAEDPAILSQFRDLMCMSIGFLLGESKIRKKN